MASVVLTVIVGLAVSVLSGVSHGQKTCKTDQVSVMSQLVTCVIKEHPEYLFTVFAKFDFDNPESLETPDFMCSHPKLMTDVVKCFLEYVEGCMSPDVASQVKSVMPTHDTVLTGVKFLCEHRKDFENPCVSSHAVQLGSCFSDKLKAFSAVTSSGASGITNMQETLCRVLKVERTCVEENLRECPKSVSASLTEGILSFFPDDKCNTRDDNVKIDNSLRFKPFRRH